MIITCLRKLISGDKVFIAKLMDSYKAGFPTEITEMQGSNWLVSSFIPCVTCTARIQHPVGVLYLRSVWMR